MNKYKIKIQCKNPEYFLRLIISQNIKFSNVNKKYKNLTLIIDEENYKKISSLKTSYKVEIIKMYGLIKYKYLLKKYSVFLIGIILFIMLINLTTNFIFNIKIIHDDKDMIVLVKTELNKYNVTNFSLKKNNKELDEIVENILEENKEKIEWMEIKEIGVTYIIEVQERKIKEEQTECDSQSIIAKKDSRIISITAESGEIVKAKNDYVKAGEIIISGLIYNNEKIMEKKCAIGKVFGEVWYNIIVEIPKNYETSIKTGEENYGIELEILDNSYTLIGGYEDYESSKIPIISSNIFPLSITFSNFFEINKEKHQYNYNNVDEDALTIAEEKLFDSLAEDSEVISKKVLEKTEKDSKIIVEVFFKVKENITDTISIEDINIEEENNNIEEE